MKSFILASIILALQMFVSDGTSIVEKKHEIESKTRNLRHGSYITRRADSSSSSDSSDSSDSQENIPVGGIPDGGRDGVPPLHTDTVYETTGGSDSTTDGYTTDGDVDSTTDGDDFPVYTTDGDDFGFPSDSFPIYTTDGDDFPYIP